MESKRVRTAYVCQQFNTHCVHNTKSNTQLVVCDLAFFACVSLHLYMDVAQTRWWVCGQVYIWMLMWIYGGAVMVWLTNE